MWPKLLEWLEKYGGESIVVLVISGALYVFWETYIKYIFQKKYSDYKRKNDNPVLEDKPATTEEQKDMLKHQDFFSNVEFKINVDIPSEDFSKNPVKKCLYKNILLILFEAYHENMLIFIKNLDVNWDKHEWLKELNTVNYKIIEELKSKSTQRGIPKKAIQFFLTWYNPFMQQIYFYMRKISDMDNRNAVDNTNTYLLLLELILMNTLSDIKNIGNFDFELDGLEYKGQIITGEDG